MKDLNGIVKIPGDLADPGYLAKLSAIVDECDRFVESVPLGIDATVVVKKFEAVEEAVISLLDYIDEEAGEVGRAPLMSSALYTIHQGVVEIEEFGRAFIKVGINRERQKFMFTFPICPEHGVCHGALDPVLVDWEQLFVIGAECRVLAQRMSETLSAALHKSMATMPGGEA